MGEEFDPETLKVGDRVRHTDGDDRTAVVKSFPAFGRAVVEWEDTGRESEENVYLLLPVDN